MTKECGVLWATRDTITTSETLEQVAQKGSRCPVLENIQGQARWNSEQPDPLEDVLAHGGGGGLDDL